MKIYKSVLKKLIKECINEVLEGGPGSGPQKGGGSGPQKGGATHPTLKKPEYQSALKWLGKRGKELANSFSGTNAGDEEINTELKNALWDKTDSELQKRFKHRPGMGAPDADDVRNYIKQMPAWPKGIDTAPSEIADDWLEQHSTDFEGDED